MTARWWWLGLGALAALRVVPPIVALAAEGHDVPGLPRFDLVEGTGDDAGFLAAAREYVSASGGLPLPLLALAVLLTTAALAAAALRWRRREERPWLVAGAALALGVAMTLPVLRMAASGSAVLGWPLLWAVALAPARALGEVDHSLAFAIGFGLSLLANVVALVATAYAGLYATGRRGVGLGAAAALAVWPLLTRAIAGPSAWENGTWFVDTGLALYTEPFSTALVTVALAILLRPGRGDVALAAAGVALSFATLVKLTNGFVGLAATIAVASLLGPRRAFPLAAGGLACLPALAAYWPIGYVQDEGARDDLLPADPFSLDYAVRNWTDSLEFGPRALLVLVPLALLGTLTLRSRPYALALLAAAILPNVAVYTFYEPTVVHPRFFFASLPALFVLWALGIETVRAGVRGRTAPLLH